MPPLPALRSARNAGCKLSNGGTSKYGNENDVAPTKHFGPHRWRTGSAREGKTILEAARANGKHIPTLCYLKGLSAVGACRVCVVELAGTDRLLPACTTPMQEGMSIKTASARLALYRRMAVELLLVERNHICSSCVSNGHCELQALAQDLGVTHVRYAYNNPRLPVDMTHPRFVLDHNRCILCTRCVRVCAEVEGANVWEVGVARHLLAHCERPQRRLGQSDKLHCVRQMRPGLPHRRSRGKRLRRARNGEEEREGKPSCHTASRARHRAGLGFRLAAICVFINLESPRLNANPHIKRPSRMESVMLDLLRKSLCIALAWFLILIPTVQAQQSTATPSAPVPPQILSAHSVFVSNGGGSNYFNIFTGGPDRAYNTFYADLERANRYQLVGAPAQADIIFEIRAIAPAVGDVDNVGYNPQLILSILDPQTNVVLWTSSANVRALGTQMHRDQGFDQSVEVLVDKLSQVTGQPLSNEQAKAIHNNSRMSTGMKAFIVVSIAATAALAAYGAYRVSHPPALPTLTTPTLP